MTARLYALRASERTARQREWVGGSPGRPLAIVPVPPGAAPRMPAHDLVGTWDGHYACGATPDTAFKLTIATPDNTTPPAPVTGTFRFTLPRTPGGPPGVSGSFRLVGQLPESDGSFVLAPTEWIDRPSGFTAIGLSGRISADGTSLSGTLLGCGSAAFTARRGGADGVPAPTGPRLPPMPLAAGMGGRLAAADSLQAQCKLLADWGKPLLSRPDVMTAPVDRLEREALPLFQDKVFRPIFGLSYVLTTPEQRRPIYFLLLRDCPQRAGLRELNNYDLAPPWSPREQGGFGYAAVTARLVDLGPAQQQTAAAIAQLSRLPATENAAAAVNRIAAEDRANVEQLDESRRQAFAYAVAEARTRIAAGLLHARVQEAASLPADPASLVTLHRLSEDLARSDLPEAAKGAAMNDVRNVIQGIAGRLIAADVTAATGDPVTLAGLADATAALRRADQTVETVRPDLPDLSGLDRDTIGERRRAIMADPGVQHDFAQGMDAAAASGSESAVAAAARPYLQPRELARLIHRLPAVEED